MKRKHSLCSTVSARRRPPSSAWARGVTDARAWQVRARVYATASDGVERSCVKSAGKYPRFRMVSMFVSLALLLAQAASVAGLTDYEVRDLNDEINKLMREKRHWENQIIALGGANYRRNVAMLDDDGKEVPGTKGYKCVATTLLLGFILTSPKILRSRKRAARCKRALPEPRKRRGRGEPSASILQKVLEPGPGVFRRPRRAGREAARVREGARGGRFVIQIDIP